MAMDHGHRFCSRLNKKEITIHDELQVELNKSAKRYRFTQDKEADEEEEEDQG